MEDVGKTINKQLVNEEKVSLGIPIVEVEHKETTPINANGEKIGATQTETKFRVPDLEIKAAAILGIEFKFDFNKAWEILGRNLLGK